MDTEAVLVRALTLEIGGGGGALDDCEYVGNEGKSYGGGDNGGSNRLLLPLLWPPVLLSLNPLGPSIWSSWANLCARAASEASRDALTWELPNESSKSRRLKFDA